MNITFETRCSDMDDTTTQAKEKFVTAISRGGLAKPSNYINVASVHASALCTYILSHDNLKKSLFDTKDPRDTFVESYMHIIETDVNSSQQLLVECKNKHRHDKNLRRVAFTIFNISAKHCVRDE